MAEDINDFLSSLEGKPSFKSEPWYNQAGDCLEFYLVSDESYADRVDTLLTVFRAFDTDQIVGFQLKGITAIHQVVGDFDVQVSANKGTISILVMAAFLQGGHDKSRYDRDSREGVYNEIRTDMADALRRPIPELV